MIFIAVFFVDDRQRATGGQLVCARLEHEVVGAMLVPALEHHVIHPRRFAEGEAARAMNARRVVVWIPFLHERTHFLGPRLVATKMPLIDEIPPHVRKRSEPRHAVAVVSLFVGIAHVRFAERIDALVSHVESEDQGDLQIAAPSMA